MPSIEESKRKVKAGLEKVNNDETDHDAILATYAREIDEHNQRRTGTERATHRHRHASHDSDTDVSKPPRGLRFKSSTTGHRKRKRSSERRSRHHHRTHHTTDHNRDSEQEEAHPFPREPVARDREEYLDSNAAFRESLFDALADDEGAAYWESIYSQPIHIYPRPAKTTPQGVLEQMSDDDYADYVQTKMWEKKNPHIVRERDRRERERRLEEEERTRRREEFVRRKQRAAWAEREKANRFAGLSGTDENGDDYEYVFDFESTNNTMSGQSSRQQQKQDLYRHAWDAYLGSWEKLKHELAVDHGSSSQIPQAMLDAEKRIPWPVLPHQVVVKKNIEDFIKWITVAQVGLPKLQLLKVERVRWHPDKMQQRFKGQISEDTMKLVTGVFQVVDMLFEAERSHAERIPSTVD